MSSGRGRGVILQRSISEPSRPGPPSSGSCRSTPRPVHTSFGSPRAPRKLSVDRSTSKHSNSGSKEVTSSDHSKATPKLAPVHIEYKYRNEYLLLTAAEGGFIRHHILDHIQDGFAPHKLAKVKGDGGGDGPSIPTHVSLQIGDEKVLLTGNKGSSLLLALRDYLEETKEQLVEKSHLSLDNNNTIDLSFTSGERSLTSSSPLAKQEVKSPSLPGHVTARRPHSLPLQIVGTSEVNRQASQAGTGGDRSHRSGPRGVSSEALVKSSTPPAVPPLTAAPTAKTDSVTMVTSTQPMKQTTARKQDLRGAATSSVSHFTSTGASLGQGHTCSTFAASDVGDMPMVARGGNSTTSATNTQLKGRGESKPCEPKVEVRRTKSAVESNKACGDPPRSADNIHSSTASLHQGFYFPPELEGSNGRDTENSNCKSMSKFNSAGGHQSAGWAEGFLKQPAHSNRYKFDVDKWRRETPSDEEMKPVRPNIACKRALYSRQDLLTLSRVKVSREYDESLFVQPVPFEVMRDVLIFQPALDGQIKKFSAEDLKCPNPDAVISLQANATDFTAPSTICYARVNSH